MLPDSQLARLQAASRAAGAAPGTWGEPTPIPCVLAQAAQEAAGGGRRGVVKILASDARDRLARRWRASGGRSLRATWRIPGVQVMRRNIAALGLTRSAVKPLEPATRLFLHYLEKRFVTGELTFFKSHRHLHEPAVFRRYLAPVWKTEWVIYTKRPFAGPGQVLDYVGRYTHRVAISNNRLVSMDNGKVSFRWKDYRDGDCQKTMTLDGEEFLRRFLIHVLPDGFHRIRYYGFLANCHRERKLALCRKLLGMAPMEPTADPPADYRDRSEALTGCSLHECPHCRTGIMVVIGCIARPTVFQPIPNTS